MVIDQGQMYLLMIVLSIGFIVGAALAWWLASRGRSAPSDPELDELKRLRQRFTEQVTLWRENASGKLLVRTDGKMATGAQQLSDNQRKFMNALLKEWLVWMGFPGSQPATPPPAVTSSAPVTAEPASSVSIEEARLASATSQPPAATPQPPTTPPAPPPMPTEQAAARPAGETPKSIVEQIDAILQEKLKARPAFGKGVKLTEDRREGVVVWVGLDRFAGVDAVTDPEVKALLREAVQEWERQNQVGKK